MKASRVKIPLPRIELIIYNNLDAEFPNRGRVHARSFLSWILEMRSEGYKSFVLPYPQNANQTKALKTIKHMVCQAGKKYGFRVTSEKPPQI